MKLNLRRTVFTLLIFTLFLAGIACSSSSGDVSQTVTQEEHVDEGDIIKVHEDGTIFSLQSDGLALFRRGTDGTPQLIAKDVKLYDKCIPQELYLYNDYAVVIIGEMTNYYTGDYSSFRTSDYKSVLIMAYDLSFLQDEVIAEDALQNSMALKFRNEGTARQTRMTEDGQLYVFTERQATSPDVDEYGNVKGFSRRKQNSLTTSDTLIVDIYGRYEFASGWNVLYDSFRMHSYSSALYVEPSTTMSFSPTLVSAFKMSFADNNPHISQVNAFFGADLSTVYMTENYIYPVFSGSGRGGYGCSAGGHGHLMLLKVDLELVLLKKAFLSDSYIPSRYAFKELNGYLYMTVEKGYYVSLLVFSPQLEVINSQRLCSGEDLKAVTYRTETDGRTYCLAVTFLEYDPLYKIDITDPNNLVLLSELSISGYSVYLHVISEKHTVGFGYEAEPDGTITAAKVTLFNTAGEQTYEVNSILIPNVDYAEALDDPRALCMHPNGQIFGFSLRRYERADNGATIYKQGFYLFGVINDRLVDLAYLSNFERGFVGEERVFYDYTTYRKTINRGIMTDDYLYTVSDGMIATYSIDAIKAGDKQPMHVLQTSLTTGGIDQTTPPDREEGIFWEG